MPTYARVALAGAVAATAAAGETAAPAGEVAPSAAARGRRRSHGNLPAPQHTHNTWSARSRVRGRARACKCVACIGPASSSPTGAIFVNVWPCECVACHGPASSSPIVAILFARGRAHGSGCNVAVSVKARLKHTCAWDQRFRPRSLGRFLCLG